MAFSMLSSWVHFPMGNQAEWVFVNMGCEQKSFTKTFERDVVNATIVVHIRKLAPNSFIKDVVVSVFEFFG